MYQSISPSDFFYRNREIAGFSNPSRAVYAAVRELLENALDACEVQRVPPDIYLRLTETAPSETGSNLYTLRIEDNGTGQRGEESEGFGLLGLRERIALSGGSLEAGNRPEGGFRLQAIVPRQAQEDE